GDTRHEDITVSTADGSTQHIDITIEGRNDSAVITGDTTGSVIEAGGVDNAIPGMPTAIGTLHATDVDNSPTFTAQNDVAEAYGRFSITSAGSWSYTLDNNNNATVEALNVGDTLFDHVTVSTADGTTKWIDIEIKGANDAAVITGDTNASVVEAGGVNNNI